jgi:hypothetical protein
MKTHQQDIHEQIRKKPPFTKALAQAEQEAFFSFKIHCLRAWRAKKRPDAPHNFMTENFRCMGFADRSGHCASQ